MPRPSFDRLAALAGPPEIHVFDQADAKYQQFAQLGKRPQTLGQLQADLGSPLGGTAQGPDGRTHRIDLAPYKDRDPDSTFVAIAWSMPGLSDLRGMPRKEARAEAMRRLGLR